jgi:hypothetical protein
MKRRGRCGLPKPKQELQQNAILLGQFRYALQDDEREDQPERTKEHYVAG